MTASQIREKGRKSLEGKWGKAALLTLSYFVIIWLITFVIASFSEKMAFIGTLLDIAWIVISIPISFGILSVFVKLKREDAQNIGYADFFNFAFSNFANAWKVFGNMLLKILPITIAFVIGILLMAFGGIYATIHTDYFFLPMIGIIIYIVSFILLIPKTFSYALSYLILYDNPDLSGKEIVEKSEQLMRFNRWKLFCLYFSFIGWAFLCVFTFGIGYLWLLPYMSVSFVAFYDTLLENDSTNTTNDAITE